MEMWPCCSPAHRASRSGPSSGRSGGPILAQRAHLGHLGVGQQQVLRAGLGPDALTPRLGLLDALQPQVGAEMHDVGGAAGGAGHGYGPVDGFLLGPVGAGHGEELRVGVTLGDELVLQILDDIAALAVQLQHPAGPGHHLHGAADVIVVAHPAGDASCRS